MIVELAKSVASPSESEEALLETLCTAAEGELLTYLRPGVTAEDCQEAFCCAAALLAVSTLVACRESGGVEQFTVGEVSVRSGGGSSARADALRQQALYMLLPYCADDGFAFLGVPG
jgi:hypothetical protein